MEKISKIRQSRGDRLFGICNGILLALFFVITMYPLIYVISASISSPDAVTSGRMILWPVDITWKGYQYILQYGDIWTGYKNTIFYTFFGTIINLVATLPCAYGLSRRDVPFRGFVMTLFLITMYINGGLIPGYMNITQLGLLNTRWALLIPGAVSTYNLIVARTFFANTIPWELHEAAFLDGCSNFRLFVKIVLPLSAPIVVVMMLYYGVAHWNSYFNAMMYLSDRAKYPLQVFLREILTKGSFAADAIQSGAVFTEEEMIAMIKEANTANLIKYCVIIVSTVPMMIIYPFLQRFFTKGVMIGAVKG